MPQVDFKFVFSPINEGNNYFDNYDDDCVGKRVCCCQKDKLKICHLLHHRRQYLNKAEAVIIDIFIDIREGSLSGTLITSIPSVYLTFML